jgi:hypothetical protein
MTHLGSLLSRCCVLYRGTAWIKVFDCRKPSEEEPVVGVCPVASLEIICFSVRTTRPQNRKAYRTLYRTINVLRRCNNCTAAIRSRDRLSGGPSILGLKQVRGNTWAAFCVASIAVQTTAGAKA